MNSNKIFFSMIVFLVALFIGLTSVFADCSDCSASNCEACGCVRVEDTCAYPNLNGGLVSCGSRSNQVRNIPDSIPKVTSTIYIIIQIVVPILLVVIGMFDLVKSVIAQKEEDMKKARQTLIKRLIVAILVFFVFVVVKFLISLVADNGVAIMDCAECFIKNDCDRN